MNKIITEITPLSEKDCFYLIDRLKDRFTYPVHRHEEYELNFLAGCAGARRVVGDSMETLGEYDLVLVGNGIEHGWEQHQCTNDKIREITIQFSHDLFGESLLAKTQLSSIRRMLQLCTNGIAFNSNAIMKVFNRLDNLTRTEVGFFRMLTHYKEEIRLADLAALVGMTPTAFSRFFKLRTGRSISDYLIDIRLGHATRALVDSTTSVAEICYECGFNNISNFNRIFKKKKGNSPKVFRDIYQHHKALI